MIHGSFKRHRKRAYWALSSRGMLANNNDMAMSPQGSPDPLPRDVFASQPQIENSSGDRFIQGV
jgi:hypothetical protein